MVFLASIVLLQTPVILRPDQLLTYSRSVVASGSQQRVEALFQSKGDAAYLFEMARGRGGLKNVSVHIIPSPPGWQDTAEFWAVFSARQDIQEDHDPVYPVLRTTEGLKFGKEMPEWAGIESRISDVRADVSVDPAKNMASITATVKLDGKPTSRATIFRLGNPYALRQASLLGKDGKVWNAGPEMITPAEGDVVRAGGLLIPWTTKAPSEMSFSYDGIIRSDREDKIDATRVYLTAWWTPGIGRLPHTISTRITGPKEWVLKGEGPEMDALSLGFPPLATPRADQKSVAFRCSIPISFPKVIGGAYTLAAETTVGGRNFRAYHLNPVEPQRGQKEVQAMASAVEFFEKNLTPFPFDHYYGFDAIGYYGIESYSHTLLEKGITLQFMSHEIAHTYFGGITPSTYVKDTWNEGVTQYMDSIVYLKNTDRTLEMGLQTVDLGIPLVKMGVAHANDSATYYRGAYVMRMLEDEIGQDKVLAGLRAMLKDRVGRDTAWPDLMPYFEAASGQDLDWFWKQWIEDAKFPTLTVRGLQSDQVGRQWRNRVTVTQSGTPDPFRLRYKIVLRQGSARAEQVVSTEAPGEVFSITTDFKPTSAEVVAFPHTLAHIGRSTGRL